MTITDTVRQDAWQRLETLGTAICRPPRRRDARGRWIRADAGEWDWYYGLPDSDREYVRRRFMRAGGTSPDQAASAAGYGDVEAWASVWIETLRLTRPDSDIAEWERADWYPGVVPPSPGVLVGPSEVAALLGVKPATVHQWVARRVLPEPWDIVSGTRLWARHDILAWAESTARLPSDGLRIVSEAF